MFSEMIRREQLGRNGLMKIFLQNVQKVYTLEIFSRNSTSVLDQFFSRRTF